MKRLNIAVIRIDGGTQVRKQLNQDKVQEYADLMRDKVEFPPITVFFDGSDYWLSSGFHRYFATKQIGNVSIDCDVHEGTVRDAKLFAYGANKHGLPHSPEENRQIVLELIKDEEWGKWSNAQIAKHIGLSAMTVGRIRKSLEEPPKEEVTYVNKHGKQTTMKTKNVGKKKEPKVEVKEEPPSVEDKIQELTDTVVILDKELTQARDVIATKRWNATEIEVEDIHDTVVNLREQIRVLEIDNKALRDSRDMYQQRNAELIRQVKSLSKKK
jgi:hypothetical protein